MDIAVAKIRRTLANQPKLIKLPGTFFDAVARLLNTAPPPKGAKARAQREQDKKTTKTIRKRSKMGERKKAR
jgi:hypothetical protein